MTRWDDDDPGDTTAVGLLILSTDHPDQGALARLYEALDQRGFRRGHLVGPVLPVMAPEEHLHRLADHVGMVREPRPPTDADHALLAALAPVEQFAWDEGAETF